MDLAREGIERLHKEVDSLIVIPNQQLLKIVDKKAPARQAFLIADDVLRQGVEGISNIITKAGDVNTDFADVTAAMKGQGDAILGVGVGSGENRAVDAATNAIRNPLLEDSNIDGAKNILINVCSNGGISLSETAEIAKIVTASAAPRHKVFWGNVTDSSMPEDEVSVTVIATGFNQAQSAPEKKPVHQEIPVEKNESNLVGIGEFDNLLHGKAAYHHHSEELFDEGEFVKVPVAEKVVVEEEPQVVAASSERGDGGTLGRDLASSSYLSRRPTFASVPQGSVDSDNLEVPTLYRLGKTALTREINLR